MATWFTADTHFGHTNIIKYCDRPFETKEEHDRELIKRWNSCVQKGDIIYHLGDFGFGDPYYLVSVAQKLHGKIYFLRGNHDRAKALEALRPRFMDIKDVHQWKNKYKNKHVRIWMSHYAHRSWPFMNHGGWHLFGHSHGNMPPHGLSCDVGVDCWNYTPVSMTQIFNFMSERQTLKDYNDESDRATEE